MLSILIFKFRAMKLRNPLQAFTLIELMVVIAIIGVLAVSIVPQLTGAQARARDTGRIASVKNVTAVLETYNSDEGTYPLSPNDSASADDPVGTLCLSTENGTVHPDLAALFKGGKAPIDPQSKNKSGGCGVDASIAYSALVKDGVSQAGYILISNVEAFKKANLDSTWVSVVAAGTTSYNDVQLWTGWGELSAEPTLASDSVYAEIN